MGRRGEQEKEKKLKRLMVAANAGGDALRVGQAGKHATCQAVDAAQAQAGGSQQPSVLQQRVLLRSPGCSCLLCAPALPPFGVQMNRLHQSQSKMYIRPCTCGTNVQTYIKQVRKIRHTASRGKSSRKNMVKVIQGHDKLSSKPSILCC